MGPVAFNLRGREGGAQAELSGVASLRAASGGSSRSYVAGDMGEGGNACSYDPLPDGRRYAACGDGVVSNVAEWIALRLSSAIAAERSEAA